MNLLKSAKINLLNSEYEPLRLENVFNYSEIIFEELKELSYVANGYNLWLSDFSCKLFKAVLPPLISLKMVNLLVAPKEIENINNFEDLLQAPKSIMNVWDIKEFSSFENLLKLNAMFERLEVSPYFKLLISNFYQHDKDAYEQIFISFKNVIQEANIINRTSNIARSNDWYNALSSIFEFNAPTPDSQFLNRLVLCKKIEHQLNSLKENEKLHQEHLYAMKQLEKSCVTDYYFNENKNNDELNKAVLQLHKKFHQG